MQLPELTLLLRSCQIILFRFSESVVCLLLSFFHIQSLDAGLPGLRSATTTYLFSCLWRQKHSNIQSLTHSLCVRRYIREKEAVKEHRYRARGTSSPTFLNEAELNTQGRVIHWLTA